MAEEILLSWSGGKDSAMTLHEIRKNPDFEIAALLTTVTEEYDRISMHGVRRVLLERQAESLGLPLEKVVIPQKADNEAYEFEMKKVLAKYKEQGVRAVAFGDIFLEDLRKYREENLARIGMRGLFPIWKRETSELSQRLFTWVSRLWSPASIRNVSRHHSRGDISMRTSSAISRRMLTPAAKTESSTRSCSEGPSSKERSHSLREKWF